MSDTACAAVCFFLLSEPSYFASERLKTASEDWRKYKKRFIAKRRELRCFKAKYVF